MCTGVSREDEASSVDANGITEHLPRRPVGRIGERPFSFSFSMYEVRIPVASLATWRLMADTFSLWLWTLSLALRHTPQVHRPTAQ